MIACLENGTVLYNNYLNLIFEKFFTQQMEDGKDGKGRKRRKLQPRQFLK